MKSTADVVCFSHLRWDFVFQRPNHLISRCALERRAFFWEEPIVDPSLPPGGARLDIRAVTGTLRVATPRLPAGLDAEAAEREQRRLLDAMMAEHAIRAPVLWFYTPMALGFAAHAPACAVVYDCMDELSAFLGAPPALVAREAELLQRADLVFTGGRSLYEAKRLRHARVYPFPSSVDRAHFFRARVGRLAEPADQAEIPRPRLGYCGVIDERIDLALLAAIAEAEPSWQIVMLGPVVKIDPASLPQRRNIHYLGQRSYADLPAYLTGWSVALMPFAQNDATRYISPTKTLEYLAAGKPVVSTPIRDVVTPYGERGAVRIADRTTFARQIAAALAAPGAMSLAADALVARTSWDRTWREMWSLVEGVVRRRARSGAEAPLPPTETADESAEGRRSCSTI